MDSAMNDNGRDVPDVRDVFDSAIDDVVRDMIGGDPDPSFRARVMERLGERPSPWRSVWILSPVAVAAVLFFAVIVQRDATPPAAPGAPTGARPVLSARTISAVGPARVAQPTGAGTLERNAPSAQTGTLFLSPVAALAPARLEVPSLVITAMDSGPSLQVPELETLTPMAVTPIGEPQGDRR